MQTLPATFLERPNRFVARVQLADGNQVVVHVASSGRMADVLLPGAPVRVHLDAPSPGRKTAGRLVMAQAEGTWVSVDTSLPGRLFRQAFAAGQLAPFAGYQECQPEVPFGESRLDFCLTGPGLPPCLVEVKSVTSVRPDPDGVRVARFPDAPTSRGTRHLHELMQARRQGYRPVVCFMVQREDAEACGPWDAIDPTFGDVLRLAAASGVEVLAWRLHVQPASISLGAMLPIRLGPSAEG